MCYQSMRDLNPGVVKRKVIQTTEPKGVKKYYTVSDGTEAASLVATNCVT